MWRKYYLLDNSTNDIFKRNRNMLPVVKVLTFLYSVAIAHATYSVHFVDHRCRKGKDTVFYDLDTSGSSSSMILKASKITPYKPNRNCTIFIQPPVNYGVVLAVRKIDFIQGHLLTGRDYLKVYHSAPSSPTWLYDTTFDSDEQIAYTSDGPMTLLYHTDSKVYGHHLETGFEVTITATTTSNVECSKKFHCDNGRCIAQNLFCDDHNNCGDLSDESKTVCKKHPIKPEVSVTMIVAIAFSLVFFLCCCVVHCFKKLSPSPDNASETASTEPCTTPYEAIHPSYISTSQNPAGPSNTDQPQQPSLHWDGAVVDPFDETMWPSPSRKPPPHKPRKLLSHDPRIPPPYEPRKPPPSYTP